MVTLVMACVLLGGWVRSSHLNDNLCVIVGQEDEWASIGLISIGQQFGVVHIKPIHQALPTKRFGWEEKSIAQGRAMWSFLIDGKSQWLGFGCLNTVDRSTISKAVLVPFWSIVIPLTVLSSFLLLSKTCKSTQNKINEPMATEGA